MPITAAAATAINSITKKVMFMKMIPEVRMKERKAIIMAAAVMTTTMKKSPFITTIPMILKWPGIKRFSYYSQL